jgi:serine phosphatase RsbU (regulator of sigma subunit)
MDLLTFQQEVARLQALLEASRRVHATIDEDQVLGCALELAAKELEADGALFTGTGAVYGTIPENDGGAAARVALRTKAGELMTELVLFHSRPEGLSLEEEDFLEGLALQAAVALENARYHRRSLEFQRIERDLEAARAIQRSLLPQTLPDVAGLAIGARSTTCYEVGGDYLDILPLASGELIMIVADVAGKGLASAMIASSFRSAFRAMALSGIPLPEQAARMNELHWGEGAEARRRYVTAILMRLMPGEGVIRVVNAGHNPGLLVRPDGGVTEIEASGPPLGMLPRRTYQEEVHEFAAGSRLLLYTDGLTEVFRGDEEFGPERLLEAFRAAPPEDAGAVLERVWQAIEAFSGGAAQSDDMTALTLARIGKGTQA